ncbi:MAG: ribbon-helix-helix domain-containing protein [Isosphaeraceae bacterium]
MTIQLPNELESRVQAVVHSGRFASMNEAITEAVRLLLREVDRVPAQANPGASHPEAGADPLLGLMRDDAELMDEIVADAYRRRREDRGRKFDL